MIELDLMALCELVIRKEAKTGRTFVSEYRSGTQHGKQTVYYR